MNPVVHILLKERDSRQFLAMTCQLFPGENNGTLHLDHYASEQTGSFNHGTLSSTMPVFSIEKDGELSL